MFGSYHLRRGSPCIDAADGEFAPPRDILGKARHNDPMVWNTGVGSPTCVDMGAYEAQYLALPGGGCLSGGSAPVGVVLMPFGMAGIVVASKLRRRMRQDRH